MSVPTVGVIEYGAGGLVVVAGVVKPGDPETTADVSLFTNPVIVKLNVGLTWPNVRVALPAVTVSARRRDGEHLAGVRGPGERPA